MKNVVILHGTGDNSQKNWFPWLSAKLKNQGYKVWAPDLPEADKPDVCNYNPFLLDNWDFNDETIMIGHSSGAVSIIGFLNKLPEGRKIKTAISVAGFKDNLGWEALDGLFIYPFDWKRIRKKAGEFVFINSDDDPYVPLEHGKYLAGKLDGELIIRKGEKHFSVTTGGKRFKKLPLILDLIKLKSD